MKVEQISARSTVFAYTLPEWDLNLHLITAKTRNYLIDTGLGPDSVTPVLEYLDGPAKPLVVINTHYHWDHVWGNHCFDGHTILSHTLCRERIESEWDEMLARNKDYVQGIVRKRLPDLVFSDSVYFPDDKIRVFYTPGHSADSISVYDEKDRVLNAGDNIGDTMDEIVPELDTARAVYQSTLRTYAALDASLCVSGHNRVLGGEIFAQIQAALGG